MTERFDPWPDLANLLSAGRAILPSIVPSSPAAMVRAITSQLVGKRLTATFGDNDVELTIVDLHHSATTLELASGRLGDVHITAADVTWPDCPLSEVVVVARDVRFRSLPQVSLHPAAVELTIKVATDVVAARVAAVQPHALVDIDAYGVLGARWTKRPQWGRIEFEPHVNGESVRLEPSVIEIRGRRLRAPRFVGELSFALDELPEGLQVLDVRTRAGELELQTVATSWPSRLASVPLPEVLAWLSNAALTGAITKLWR